MYPLWSTDGNHELQSNRPADWNPGRDGEGRPAGPAGDPLPEEHQQRRRGGRHRLQPSGGEDTGRVPGGRPQTKVKSTGRRRTLDFPSNK